MQKLKRGVAQFGRAPRSGRGGRKFKSCHLDQEKQGAVMHPVFYYKTRFELADEFPKIKPQSGADFREEPPAEVPIKSGKSKSPRPRKTGRCYAPCFYFYYRTRFELADEFPKIEPQSVCFSKYIS